MAHPTGESESDALRVDFDRRLMLQFRGSVVTSDAGLLAYRELDDALGLSVMAGEMLADARTGKNGRHALAGLLRQSVFGRLAGYEDVNDAEILTRLAQSASSGHLSRVPSARLGRIPGAERYQSHTSLAGARPCRTGAASFMVARARGRARWRA